MTSVSCSIDEQFVNPLFEVFDGGDFSLSSWRDIEASKTVVEVFVADPKAAPLAAAALAAAGKIVGLGLKPETRTFPDEDWKLAYRRYFHVDVISPRLVIRPPWESFSPAAGQHVLTLDPVLSFGTGRHETTHACLEFIDRLAAESLPSTCSTRPTLSFLDMGTGSGILAIAARLLGLGPVRGFDIDPDAVDIARKNAALNQAEIAFAVSDLSKDHAPAQVVAANVLAPLLVRFAPQIAAAVAPGGRLVLSGILDKDFTGVVAAFAPLGFRPFETLLRGEWRTGLFVR